MAGGSDGYRAALARRQLTLGLISSSPGMDGLPPFIDIRNTNECVHMAHCCFVRVLL